MSDLQPSILSLDKGLDLQTAKIMAPQGSILDTINYEQVDFRGQKRIDGYCRYDGSMTPTLDDWYQIELSDSLGVVKGDIISTLKGVVGVAVEDESLPDVNPVIKIAILNTNFIPVINDNIFKTEVGNTDFITVVSITKGVDTTLTPAEHQALLITYANNLRSRIGKLPGHIIGLHWFRDRLYAVANVVAFTLQGNSPTIYPNDTVNVLDGDPVKVLDSFILGGDRAVLVDSLDRDPWVTETIVYTGSDPVGTIILGPRDFDYLEGFSSFFESRSELQVLDEDAPGPYHYGWRFVDQGWLVNFATGLSLFGSLPSLNQNITGLGIEGPTDTSGSNGSPLALAQKIVVAGKPVQVNGWKSTGTPTTFELNPADVVGVDTDYCYADAFIAWDGTTGEVTSPGNTSDTLIEYPATATIVVT